MNSIYSKENKDKKIENVLVLQGGGSLGAFGCGVFKAIANNNIGLDIVAGTSIGGINAAIIAGSKDEKHPEKTLEQFWIELSESFVDLDKVNLSPTLSSLPDFVEKWLVPFSYSSIYGSPIDSAGQKENYASLKTDTYERAIRMKQLRAFYSSAIFGNDGMFKPRWKQENALTDHEYFRLQN